MSRSLTRFDFASDCERSARSAFDWGERVSASASGVVLWRKTHTCSSASEDELGIPATFRVMQWPLSRSPAREGTRTDELAEHDRYF